MCYQAVLDSFQLPRGSSYLSRKYRKQCICAGFYLQCNEAGLLQNRGEFTAKVLYHTAWEGESQSRREPYLLIYKKTAILQSDDGRLSWFTLYQKKKKWRDSDFKCHTRFFSGCQLSMRKWLALRRALFRYQIGIIQERCCTSPKKHCL